MRILVAVEPVDGRKGIDSLVALCREKLATDPFSGCLFIFRSRRATSIRVLAYDVLLFPTGPLLEFLASLLGCLFTTPDDQESSLHPVASPTLDPGRTFQVPVRLQLLGYL